MRAVHLALAAAVISCVEPSATVCGGGRVCPADRVCEEAHQLCVLAEQLAVCPADHLPRQVCTFEGGAGECVDGVCIETVCGDNLVTGTEECDGDTLPFTSCTQVGFYDPGALLCNARCAYDVGACTGTCGDDIRDFDRGEYCDGTLPDNGDTCVTWGYDAGRLACDNDFCAPDFDGCVALRWTQEAIVADPRSLWGPTESDVYAVGVAGLVRHWDGTGWYAVADPAFAGRDFYAVAGTASDVYIAGASPTGVILTKAATASAWTEMPLPATTGAIRGLWFGGGTGFAVGDGGVILQLVGGAWTAMTSPTTLALYSVWGASSTDVYAAGEDGLFHYAGGSWTPVSLPFIGSVKTSYAVWGLSSSDIYVVARFGQAFHYNGSIWELIDTPVCTDDLYSVWGSAADDIYIAGSGQFGKSRTLFHYNGSSWTPLESPSSIHVRTVWGTSARDVWIALEGGIYHGRGAYATLRPLGEAPSSCYTPSGDGPVPTCAEDSLSAIAGRGDNDVYAFSATKNAGVCHYDGREWTLIESDRGGITNAWTSTTGLTFGVGGVLDGTTQMCIDSSVRNRVQARIVRGTAAGFVIDAPFPPSSTLHDVHGVSDSEVYVVGTSFNVCFGGPTQGAPLAQRWNGSGWTDLVPPSGLTSLTRVWARGPDDVFMMGTGTKRFWRYTGTWTQLPDPPMSCPAVHDMLGVGSTLFLSCAGTLVSFDGTTWNVLGDHGIGFGVRMAIWAMSAAEVFVFGGNSLGDGVMAQFRAPRIDPMKSVDKRIVDAYGTPTRLFWVGDDGVHSIRRAAPW